jgi:hypothetical protein
LEFLKTLDPALLPASMRIKTKTDKDNSHWCCANEQPINTVQRTRVEKEIHTVATKVKTGYTSCDFLGWGHCSVYTTKYK